MEAINNIVGMLNGPIWGVGMLVLIVGSGLYFTIRLGFFQFVHFKDMWSRIIDKSESESGISSFASFCTTMAMRVGTGNVAGVAVALYMGGPGALFWMIIAGMTNSAVCFTECTLSVLYKNRIDGQYRSGGAYCAERGLGWKAYGAFYAAFFGLGVVLFMPAAATYTICDGFKNALGIPMWVSALVIALAMAVVVMGGVKRISSVASMLVPPMVGIYLIATVVILIANAGQIPSVIVDVVKCAFGSKEALLGGGVGIAIQQGVKRGTFSSASGMGESMPTAAAAETSHPVKQCLAGYRYRMYRFWSDDALKRMLQYTVWLRWWYRCNARSDGSVSSRWNIWRYLRSECLQHRYGKYCSSVHCYHAGSVLLYLLNQLLLRGRDFGSLPVPGR